MSLILGFGFRALHGKDTAVQTIIEARGHLYDVRRYAFGDILKLEVYEALLNSRHPYWAAMQKLNSFTNLYHASVLIPKPWSGFISDADKIGWVNEHKTSLRELLQTYGTEFRRASDPFYWVRVLGERINRENPQIAAITDMRFLNETFFVKANQGFTINVVRDGFDNGCSAHISEQQLIGYQFDYQIIVPDGNLEELKSDALSVFDSIVDYHTPKDMTTSEFMEAAFDAA